MNSGNRFGAALRAAWRFVCALPFLLPANLVLAAQQADPALPAAPGGPLPAGAGAAALPTPPSATASVLSGASNLSLSWGGYFEALAIVCFALALLWALLWLVKRYGRGSGFLGGSTGMRVESRLALGPKKWIIVVRCLDRRLVLGLTDANISLLTELPLEDEPGTAPGPAAPAKAKNGGAQKAVAPAAGKEASAEDNVFASFLRENKEGESPAK